MATSLKYSEWFLQSDYDLEVAQSMLDAKRNIYCIFMCHLSLEKALKGLFIKRHNADPLKTHNLVYFVELLQLDLDVESREFIIILNRVSVPTRYPEDLKKLMKVYSNEQTANILHQSKIIQQWIKQQ